MQISTITYISMGSELFKNSFKKLEWEDRVRKSSLMGGRCIDKRNFIYIRRTLLILYTGQKEPLSRKDKDIGDTARK